MGSITDIKSALTQRALQIFCETYHIPDEVHPQLPNHNQTIHEMPTDKIGVYTRFFEYANFRLPLSTFLVNVLRYYHIHISQLFVIGAAKVSHFEVLCRVHGFEPTVGLFLGISCYYTLDGDTYPEFLRDGDEEMDLLFFIWTADPMKVRVGERQRADGEPRLLETTVGSVVPLLPVAPVRISGELEASVDKRFGEGGGGEQVEQGDSAGGGQGVDIQPVITAADTIVEDVAPLQPMRQKKRKTVAVDASGPSYPPKKLREDYGDPSGPSVAGKPSVETIMNPLRLESPLVDPPGMSDLQYDMDQLMVPIHRSEDQAVFGATGTSNVLPTAVATTTALSTTFASAITVSTVSVDNYIIADADNEKNVQLNVEEEKQGKGEGSAAGMVEVEFEKEELGTTP
ncbi:hypothetical protein Tco_0018180 [Tanacetum coccineum]